MSEIMDIKIENNKNVYVSKDEYGAGYAFSLEEFSKHYKEAREAFFKGDLETLAEFFGLYTV